ncbi:hypothetical protein N0V93_004517 [Gnomoniopsis smithogilvyi]|uniref:Uncharacterized protein n=1 Tax=Gnomoniopsis smithogilvyi TaxID=1191159 RepID=A0A9W9CW99_9PEZI|nr:hypothetical protein N0V93_004517 [Gnomoniopsis smithogilvyi]
MFRSRRDTWCATGRRQMLAVEVAGGSDSVMVKVELGARLGDERLGDERLVDEGPEDDEKEVKVGRDVEGDSDVELFEGVVDAGIVIVL